MKRTRYSTYILLSLLVALPAVSCINEADVDECYGRSDNSIRFDVTSGAVDNEVITRSGSEAEGDDLDPLVYSAESDTLYLHRYVARESERATGRNLSAGTRGAEVNDIIGFRSKYEKFFVCATYADGDNTTYIPQSEAEPLELNSSDVWYIRNHKYLWPAQRQLRFNAYAPITAGDLLEGINLAAGTIAFDYTVPVSAAAPRKDAEVQPDLLFASTTCRRTDERVVGDLAPLNFRHALSAIKFAVRDVADGEIVDISIKGVAGSGHCTFNPGAASAPAFTWTDLGEAADYTQTFNYATQDKYPEIPSLGEAPVINDGEGRDEMTFMLVPQEIPEDALLEITFKRADGETKILSGKLRTDDIPLWEAGKEYIYTISTSSEIWTYVFEVTGSDQGPSPDDDRPEKGPFSDDPSNIIINAAVTDGAYYKVTSYRYRTRHPEEKEAVAWTAVSSDGQNQGYEKFSYYLNKYKDDIPSMTLAPTNWFPKMEFRDGEKTFGGDGSINATKYDVTFKTQYVVTDWEPDWEMRAHEERNSGDEPFSVLYNGNKITVNPIDLSMANGGTESRNTANCYVVNSGGWYKFPLYYGNSMKNGNTNLEAYHYEKGSHSESGYTSLVDFVDYKGRAIKNLPGAPVISDADSASLVWGDAYNIIDHVELDKSVTPNFVVFHVARQDLQQSNSVIAIRDAAGDIMWSWHIWVTEYWLDNTTLELKEQVVNCEAWAENKGSDADVASRPNGFYVAPRNLGWCDAKNVKYLKRTGKFTFRQAKSGKTDSLNVEQREKEIEYWIGNNTYYQWGRKDPMPGFLNAESTVKYNFGPMEYECKDSNDGWPINESIKNPNQLFGATSIDWGNPSKNNDWLTVGVNYYNLWNNFNRAGNYLKGTFEPQFVNGVVAADPTSTPIQTEDFAYSAVKTVYDPSPAGYVVPPVGFFSIFTKGRAYVDYSNAGYSDGSARDNSTSIENFNGRVEWQKYLPIPDNPINHPGYNQNYRDRNFFKFWAKSKRDGSGDEILLTGTGHRWYRAGTSRWGLGGNFNPHYVYLWSNTCSFYSGDRSAFSLAIGQQKNAPSGMTEDENGDKNIFIITSHFQGRKNMARPIRCIRED